MSRHESSRQRSLFNLAESQVFYELPLNERTRNFLRLEHLFATVEQAMEQNGDLDGRNAIVGLIDVTDLLARSDIKSELIKELERQHGLLVPLRSSPQVDAARLGHLLERLGELITTLKSPACQPGQCLRSDELVTAIRQRVSIPGGACSFDLPALHHWLSRGAEFRARELAQWAADLRPIKDGVRLALSLLRESAHPRHVTAASGFFNQTIDATLPCHLVRVGLPLTADCFPEISGGKHRFTVRFMRQMSTTSRPSQVEDDIDFDLQCCVF
ncbi:MAG TPA: cell division protein ZapD [Gammaproteobacteria bacterium]|nr:cell division protein ZapD [Gammaproteobacteria bacterium]